jgi:hypothetical protein
MSYITLRGLISSIILLNVLAPTEDRIDDLNDRFYEGREIVFDKFPKYHLNILLGGLNAKIIAKIFLNQLLE